MATHKKNHRRRPRRHHKKGKRENYAIVPEEIKPIAGSSILASNTPYVFQVSGISNYPRLSAMAACFQEYRIVKVVFKFSPLWNTYNNFTTNPTTQPYLPKFYARQITITPPGVQFGQSYMLETDTKPQTITQRKFTKTIKPTVNILASANGTMLKKSPWLSTNRNAPAAGAFTVDNTPHFGLAVWIQEDNSAAVKFNNLSYDVELHVQFRKPYFPASAVNTDLSGNPIVGAGYDPTSQTITYVRC
jgi:hypothetical protein